MADVQWLAGHAGLEPLSMGGANPLFLRPEDDGALQLAYFRETAPRQGDDPRRVVARARFGHGSQGLPGHAHGGLLFALLDEAMGFAAWLSGRMVLAGGVTVRHLCPVPLHVDLEALAWVDSSRGRKVVTRGTLCSADGTRHCEAEGLFVGLDPDRFPVSRGH